MNYKFDLFLSHSSRNKPLARLLAIELKHAGLNVWFDEWMINLGDDVILEIEKGIEQSRSMLILMSEAFFGSDWTTLERSSAQFRDPANKDKILLPVLIEACQVPQSLARLSHFDLSEVTQSRLNGLVNMIGSRLGTKLHRSLHGEKLKIEKIKDEVAVRHSKDRDAYTSIVEYALLNSKCVLLYFDIDGFTYINARHGVSLGERIIDEVLRLIQTNVPEGALVSRWHADAFVCVIQDMEERTALNFADQLTAILNRHHWEQFESDLFVTISCGVASQARRSPQLHVEWIERAIRGARSAKITGGAKARMGGQLKSSPAEIARKLASPLDYLSKYNS